MTTRNWSTDMNYLRGISGADIADMLVSAAANGSTVTLTVEDERRAMARSLIRRAADNGEEISWSDAYGAVGGILAELGDKGPDAVINRIKARLNTKGSAAAMPKGTWSMRTVPTKKEQKGKTLELALTESGLQHFGITPTKGQVIGFTRTNRHSFGKPITLG